MPFGVWGLDVCFTNHVVGPHFVGHVHGSEAATLQDIEGVIQCLSDQRVAEVTHRVVR